MRRTYFDRLKNVLDNLSFKIYSLKITECLKDLEHFDKSKALINYKFIQIYICLLYFFKVNLPWRKRKKYRASHYNFGRKAINNPSI